jgi:Big-like domain-containing protein
MAEKISGPSGLQFHGIRAPLLFWTAMVCLVIPGCSSNNTSSTPSSTTTITPGPVATITISATPLLINTNATDQFTASAKDSNGNAITTATFTWTSSAPNVATISSAGLATAVNPGVTAITATSGGVTSNTLFLSVTAPLSGRYAFLVQGFDDASGDQVAIIGSFTASDGSITAGLEDINGPNGYSAALTFTGTYTTGTDNRGLISTTDSAGTFRMFAFAAGSLSAGVPTAGRMIEFDDSSGTSSERTVGAFYMQISSDLALSSISGPYALQFTGQHAAAGSWYVNTGAFTADGNGNLTSGELDTNSGSSGSPTNGTFTATITSSADTSSNGRLTLAFTSGGSTNGVIYIVSASQALFIETDAESAAGLEAGQILAQTPGSLSLSGTAVEYEQGLGTAAGQPAAGIGLITFSNGSATFTRDYDDSGTLDGGTLTPQILSLTNSTVASNGRVALEQSSGSPFAIVYLVEGNKGFIMSSTSSATAGFLQPQAAGPFSAASIDGAYFGGSAPPTVGSSTVNPEIPIVTDVHATSPGTGLVGLTWDVSLNHGPFDSLLLGEPSLFDLTVAANGRATDTGGNIYYVISPSSFLMLNPNAGITGSEATPIIDVLQQ